MFMEPHTRTRILVSFEAMILLKIDLLCYPYDSDLVDDNFCKQLRGPGALRRGNALNHRGAYQKGIVVLIDEYDSHSAIEHGYGALVRSVILLYCSYLTLVFQANDFFAAVFGSLLKVCQRHRLKHC
jgi:hypothetical protein